MSHMCYRGCQCSELEAHPLKNHDELMKFKVRSRDVDWGKYIFSLRRRANAVYLGNNYGIVSSQMEEPTEDERRKILVCHDMMGNYLLDRHYHKSQKFDDYRFFHWGGLDYFCYFSHNFITIPPSGWINAAHTNGVRVLGTLLSEGKNTTDLQKIITRLDALERSVDALVRLAVHFKFDGYLINVECKIPKQLVGNLQYFISRLRANIESTIYLGAVLWYDGVIETGKISWQNEINNRNKEFFDEVHATLVNYAWIRDSIKTTKRTIDNEGRYFVNAFFGVDIFGRGQIGRFRTVDSVKMLTDLDCSAAFFAPAWTFESLKRYGYDISQKYGNDETNDAFVKRNDKFWAKLWPYLPTHPFLLLPLYSDFCIGSGKAMYKRGFVIGNPNAQSEGVRNLGMDERPSTSRRFWPFGQSSSQPEDPPPYPNSFFNLSRQSVLPSVPMHQLAEWNFDDAFNGSCCLRILKARECIRIFSLNVDLRRQGFVLAYAYKMLSVKDKIDIIVRFSFNKNEKDCLIYMGDEDNGTTYRVGRIYLSPFKSKFFDILQDRMDCAEIPKEMAVDSNASNGWKVRYYVVGFDDFVHLRDVGVVYRRPEGSSNTAYLGAIFLNDFVPDKNNMPPDSNAAFIEVTKRRVLNNTEYFFEETNPVEKEPLWF